MVIDRYPGPGQIVLLCEGDLAGYEASIFGRQLAELDAPIVDVRPCGTSTSIFGTADAIGRERPICVVEDRDWRTAQETENDSRRRSADRHRRGVTVVFWRAWQRNEVENYLLDDIVLLPCMTQGFACNETEASSALDEVLRALIPFQALDRVVSRARMAWSRFDPSGNLLQQVRRRPTWVGQGDHLAAPNVEGLIQQLNTNLETVRATVPVEALNDLSESFQRLVGSWQDPAVFDWRREWAGKEILSWLRMLLAARHGIRNRGGCERVDWSAMSRSERDDRDRELEHRFQPLLVSRLFDSLHEREPNDSALVEFQSIRAEIERWWSAQRPGGVRNGG